MATKDDIFNGALSLPPQERAELAAKLLRSLDDEAEVSKAAAAAAWDVELERRAREVLDGTAKTVPWGEARDRLLARLRARPQR